MGTLPDAGTVEEYRALYRDEAKLGPGVDALCARHGLGKVSITRFADGSLPVYALGESLVLKLYPPVYRGELDTEAAVLGAVAGRLPIPTPGVQATGEQDGWGYVLMERLRGESLASAWPRIPAVGRARVLEELGEGLAALHALRHPVLETLAPPDWDAFLAAQRAGCVARQRAQGLAEEWQAQIPAFLHDVPLARPERLVLLHTEIMREHLLVEEDAHGFRLSGLFDFEPAARGAPEYELASVGVFATCGDAALLRRLLVAYGYGPGELDPALSRRMLAYALLHRYSNVRWYLERLPRPAAPTLEALAACGWGCA